MNCCCRITTCSLLVATLMQNTSAGPPPTMLRTEPVANKLGLALNEYTFAWNRAPGDFRYQILVASDAAKLAADVGDLWDSGPRTFEREASAEPHRIPYRGTALADGATVWWKVRTWGEDGRPADRWSEPAMLEIPRPDRSTKTVVRATTTSGDLEFIDGKSGEAIRLGDDARIAAADYDDLRAGAGVTIAAWIQPEATGDAWQCIYRKEDGARRLLAIGKEGPFWGLWCGFFIGGDYVEFGAPCDAAQLGDGAWHHVAASFDGDWIRLFIDGKKIGEQASRGVLGQGGNAPAFIGSSGGTTEWFRGGIDDLRIYKAGLAEKAIRELAGGKVEVDAAALAAHWKFDGDTDNEATFTPQLTRNRIVLIGGTLIYEMEKSGRFETAVTARWPNHAITFRNLGWPGDDVFGTARSEFGSAQNTRSWKPPGAEAGFGYSERARQISEARPTTMIVGYGAEAAYADTDEKMRDFESGYRRMLKDFEATGAHLILLTPIRHERHERVLPNPAPQNERLQKAADITLEAAEKGGHLAFDLFREADLLSGRDAEEPQPAYRNGVHLSASGLSTLEARLAQFLGVGFGDFAVQASPDPGGNVTVSISGGQVAHQSTTRSGYRWATTLDQLPTSWGTGTVRPWCGQDGRPFQARIDGTVANTLAPDGFATIVRGPDFDQAEALRAIVNQKNQFYRYKLRPINKTYIFLFRRHEMGHLADEMHDLDELTAGHEAVISKLRIPRQHAWELELLEPWKPPRDYPDHEVPKDIPAPNIEEELAAFTVADGFQVNLFASDPMIANPINLNWDARGRAWVSTSTTYPHIKPGRIPNDRIVILEDSDDDGVADKHTVFAEGLTVPHSVLPVEGGAYVCSTTEFLFLEDKDGDDVSESRRVVYSGFGNADVHHMIHGLRWTPWGDLHFTQSIYINSFIDTPHGPRRMNGSGIWRFRPETERLDAFAVGMVNPWGFAVDHWGQSFGTDGAGGAGPHYVFPGAAFPSAVGVHRVLAGLIPGKPKNTAAEFVSGRHIPDHWQGSLLANDFRANRTVRYQLEENGSGFKAQEVETVLHSTHRSFRPVDIKMGPEGAVYVVDWYNPIIDHGEVDFHHPQRDKTHGRIWRLTAKGRPLVERPQVTGAETSALLEMLKAPEQYTRMRANRELASRPFQGMVEQINQWVADLDPTDPDYEHHRLEALWLTLAHRAGQRSLLAPILSSPSPQARAAAVRAASNWQSHAGGIDRLAILAKAVEDEHPRVRLEAVSALREIGSLEAANIALRALDLPTDNNLRFALELTVRVLRDQWLPAMRAGRQVFDGNPMHLSYALKEVNDPRAMAGLVEVVQNGSLATGDLPNAVTTIAALGRPEDVDAVLAMAKRSPSLLSAIADGAATSSHVPAGASDVVAFLEDEDRTTRLAAARLAGRWRVAAAKPKLLLRARTEGISAEEAVTLCAALANLGEFETLRTCAISGPSVALRCAAVGAWAAADPEAAARVAAQTLSSLGENTQHAQSVIGAFLSLEDGPAALAGALNDAELHESVAIAAVRLTHASGRSLPELVAALNAAGKLKPLAQDLSPEQRQALLADAAREGDADRGREIFNREAMACVACHMIENQGGRLGPDLTTVGSYMTPESLLESLLNPSSAIKQGFETAIVTRKDNSVVSGLLQRKTEDATLIRDPSGKVIAIPNTEITTIDSSPVSLMPPGLTAQLRHDELADLMKFLTSLGIRSTRD